MALTSRDETDLLLPLFEGAKQTPPFATFLERVRRRTRAATASLTLRLAEGGDPVSLFVGPDIRRLAHELKLDQLNLTDRIQYDRLRPGRVYSGDEFDDHDLARKARRAQDMRKLGLADERVVRLLDEDGVGAWLIIASAAPCTAADSALLSNLAPYAAAAVRAFVEGERSKLGERVNAAALQRAGAGWIVFDKSARILAMAPGTARLLSDLFGHPPHLGQRPRELGATVERALTDAAAAFAHDPEADERAVLLSSEPRIEAILSHAERRFATSIDAPAMVAYCRQPRAPSPARAVLLAQLFDLPRREAELAMRLADGHSLAAAGEAMGLTIETTRNYSKRLFAKLGVRGQVELVRAVHESGAMLTQGQPLTEQTN